MKLDEESVYIVLRFEMLAYSITMKTLFMRTLSVCAVRQIHLDWLHSLGQGVSDDNLPDSDNIRMVPNSHQSLYLSQASNRKSILLLIHLELLESYYISSLFLSSSRDDAIASFFDVIELLVRIHRPAALQQRMSRGTTADA